MTKLRGWVKGDPYCGTALEAIDFAIEHDAGTFCAEFLTAWREGDLAEWPEFKFRECEHKWTEWEVTGHTGDWFKPRWVKRICTVCPATEETDM